MEALVGLFDESHSWGRSWAGCKDRKSVKNVFARTAAIATCAGLLIGGCWAWTQIPACPHAATNGENGSLHEVRFDETRLRYDCDLGVEMAARRLSQVDVVTSSFDDDKPHNKSLADLRNWGDILGIFIIGVSCMAAVSAGTGGGSIYVPVMTLVMGFSPHASTVMSQSLMCGGVLAGTLLNLCRRHPLADRPLIDLDLVIFLAPAQMAGVSVGMIVNRCLPAWLLVVALVLVLTIAVLQTIKQYRKIKRERLAKVNAAESSLSAPDILEDAVELAEEDPSLSLETSATFGLSSAGPPRQVASVSQLSVQQQKSHTRKLQGRSEEAAKEQEETLSSSTSKDSQIIASTTDDSPRDGVFRGERIQSPEFGVQGCASEMDVEAGSSRVALDLPEAPEDHKTQNQAASAPEEETFEVGPRDRRFKSRIFRLRRARRKLREMQHRHDILKWLLVVAIWLADISLGIIRGGKGSSVQLVPYCGWAYWLLYCASVVALLVCSYVQGASLYRLQLGKDEAAIRQVPGDIHFDLTTVHMFFAQTIVAGLVAGTVGIGSSLVMGPIMLMKGMLPVVCSAVNTALVLCGSSSAAVKSLLGSVAPWDYCAFLFGLCFVCAILGKSLVDRMAQKYDADHILVLFLIIIMFGAMSGMVASGIIGLVHNVGQTFKSPCS